MRTTGGRSVAKQTTSTHNVTAVRIPAIDVVRTNLMNNAELSTLIRERFTPFAITCDCKGSDPECAVALDDPAMWGQYNTTVRIAEYISNLEDN